MYDFRPNSFISRHIHRVENNKIIDCLSSFIRVFFLSYDLQGCFIQFLQNDNSLKFSNLISLAAASYFKSSNIVDSLENGTIFSAYVIFDICNVFLDGYDFEDFFNNTNWYKFFVNLENVMNHDLYDFIIALSELDQKGCVQLFEAIYTQPCCNRKEINKFFIRKYMKIHNFVRPFVKYQHPMFLFSLLGIEYSRTCETTFDNLFLLKVAKVRLQKYYDNDGVLVPFSHRKSFYDLMKFAVNNPDECKMYKKTRVLDFLQSSEKNVDLNNMEEIQPNDTNSVIYNTDNYVIRSWKNKDILRIIESDIILCNQLKMVYFYQHPECSNDLLKVYDVFNINTDDHDEIGDLRDARELRQNQNVLKAVGYRFGYPALFSLIFLVFVQIDSSLGFIVFGTVYFSIILATNLSLDLSL